MCKDSMECGWGATCERSSGEQRWALVEISVVDNISATSGLLGSPLPCCALPCPPPLWLLTLGTLCSSSSENTKFSKGLPSDHWTTLPAEQSRKCLGMHPLLSPRLWPMTGQCRSVETQPPCLWWRQLWAVLIYPPGSRCGASLKDCPDGTLAMTFPHLCLISSRSLTGLPWEYLLNKSLAQEPSGSASGKQFSRADGGRCLPRSSYSK